MIHELWRRKTDFFMIHPKTTSQVHNETKNRGGGSLEEPTKYKYVLFHFTLYAVSMLSIFDFHHHFFYD